jgi:hypothetical protein
MRNIVHHQTQNWQKPDRNTGSRIRILLAAITPEEGVHVNPFLEAQLT